MSDASPASLFTSESVTEGHPDKLCDAVADAILDDVLAHDPNARSAVEVATTTGMVLVLGEVSTTHYVDVQEVVRRTVREIGYNDSRLGFDWETCGTMTAIKEQSPDIAMGVDHALEAREGHEADEPGAGDQDARPRFHGMNPTLDFAYRREQLYFEILLDIRDATERR